MTREGNIQATSYPFPAKPVPTWGFPPRGTPDNPFSQRSHTYPSPLSKATPKCCSWGVHLVICETTSLNLERKSHPWSLSQRTISSCFKLIVFPVRLFQKPLICVVPEVCMGCSMLLVIAWHEFLNLNWKIAYVTLPRGPQTRILSPVSKATLKCSVVLETVWHDLLFLNGKVTH